jgi:hypothetical protein
MLRNDLNSKCPVCGEPEIICELSGCDRIADVTLESEIDLPTFALHVGNKIWEIPRLQSSNN